MENYDVEERIGEGAHGVVLRAKERWSGEPVALKKVFIKRLDDGIPLQLWREVKVLQHLQHKNILRLREVFASGSGFVLALDLLPSDLATQIADPSAALALPLLKDWAAQLLSGLAYMHRNSIMHRDLKPANVLLSWEGEVRIGDLGQACLYLGEGREYSHQVATRWYRAPELLFASRHYCPKVDLWAVGCVFAELFNRRPLFPAESDIQQLLLVQQGLGSPDPEAWPGLRALPDFGKLSFPDFPPVALQSLVPTAPGDALELLRAMLTYDPAKRISADDALKHHFFSNSPAPKRLPVSRARSTIGGWRQRHKQPP